MQFHHTGPKPWHFDPSLYPKLVEELSKEKKDFYLIPGSQKEWEQVVTLYQKSPAVGGLVVVNVELIYSKTMLDGFEARLQELENRGGNPVFAPEWVKGADQAKRVVVDKALKDRIVKVEGYNAASVVPMFHGTKGANVTSILKAHFANLGTTDPGFFGNGLYFTSHAKYAENYNHTSTLLFTWLSFFSAYPVIYGDEPKLKGQPNVPKYDAHYVLVTPSSNSEYDIDCHPPRPGQTAVYDELVIFQTNQVLPRCLITLGDAGLNIKQIATSYRILDLVIAIKFFKQNPYGPFLLRSRVAKVADLLRPQDKKTPLDGDQHWFLAHLACLTQPQCEGTFKQSVVNHLLYYFQMKEPIETIEKKIVEALQSHYKGKDKVLTLFGGSVPIEQNSTQLVKVLPDAEEELPLSHGVQKEPIQLENLFDKEAEEEEPKRILLLGPPGIGKSTLCQYLAYLWATQQLWKDKFAAVIWISLRNLKGFQGSLSSFISSQLMKRETEIHPQELEIFLHANREGILFILDGYDEAQFSPDLQEEKLLHELLAYPRCILSSRPYAIQGLNMDLTVEIVGFSREEAEEYVAKRLPVEKSHLLTMQFQKHSWMKALSTNPLHLELICHLAMTKQRMHLESMTILYRQFQLTLQKLFLLKRKHSAAHHIVEGDFEGDPKFAPLMRLVEGVAWLALEKRTTLFSFQDPKIREIYNELRPQNLEDKSLFNQQLRDLGFFYATGTSDEFLNETFSFAHPTVQEFFAAQYFTRLLTKQPEQAKLLLRQQQFNPQFQLTWQFVAGLLKEKPEQLKQFFSLLETTRDLVGLYTFKLKMRCLAECSWNVEPPLKARYQKEAAYWSLWLTAVPLDQFVLKNFIEILQLDPILNRAIVPTIRESLTLRLIERDSQLLKLIEAGREVAGVMIAFLGRALRDTTNENPPFVTAIQEAFRRNPSYQSEYLRTLRKTIQNPDYIRSHFTTPLGLQEIEELDDSASQEGVEQKSESFLPTLDIGSLVKILKDPSKVREYQEVIDLLCERISTDSKNLKRFIELFQQTCKEYARFSFLQTGVEILLEAIWINPECAKECLPALLAAADYPYWAVKARAFLALGDLAILAPVLSEICCDRLKRGLREGFEAQALDTFKKIMRKAPDSFKNWPTFFIESLKLFKEAISTLRGILKEKPDLVEPFLKDFLASLSEEAKESYYRTIADSIWPILIEANPRALFLQGGPHTFQLFIGTFKRCLNEENNERSSRIFNEGIPALLKALRQDPSHCESCLPILLEGTTSQIEDVQVRALETLGEIVILDRRLLTHCLEPLKVALEVSSKKARDTARVAFLKILLKLPDQQNPPVPGFVRMLEKEIVTFQNEELETFIKSSPQLIRDFLSRFLLEIKERPSFVFLGNNAAFLVLMTLKFAPTIFIADDSLRKEWLKFWIQLLQNPLANLEPIHRVFIELVTLVPSDGKEHLAILSDILKKLKTGPEAYEKQQKIIVSLVDLIEKDWTLAEPIFQSFADTTFKHWQILADSLVAILRKRIWKAEEIITRLFHLLKDKKRDKEIILSVFVHFAKSDPLLAKEVVKFLRSAVEDRELGLQNEAHSFFEGLIRRAPLDLESAQVALESIKESASFYLDEEEKSQFRSAVERRSCDTIIGFLKTGSSATRLVAIFVLEIMAKSDPNQSRKVGFALLDALIYKNPVVRDAAVFSLAEVVLLDADLAVYFIEALGKYYMRSHDIFITTISSAAHADAWSRYEMSTGNKELALHGLKNALKADPTVLPQILNSFRSISNSDLRTLVAGFDLSAASLDLQSLLRLGLNCLAAIPLSKLISSCNNSWGSNENFVRMIITKCLAENIALFADRTHLYFYQDGLHTVEIHLGDLDGNLLQEYAKKYPMDILGSSNLSGRQIETFAKMVADFSDEDEGALTHYFTSSPASSFKDAKGNVKPFPTISIAVVTLVPSMFDKNNLTTLLAEGKLPDFVRDIEVTVTDSGALSISLLKALAKNETLREKLRRLGLRGQLKDSRWLNTIPKEQIKGFLEEHLKIHPEVYQKMERLFPQLKILQKPFVYQNSLL